MASPVRSVSKQLQIFGGALLIAASPVLAQQTTGVPGAPNATSTIDGRQLPNPPGKFGGVINRDARASKPYWHKYGLHL